MLRALVLLLALANLGFWAWSQDWLAASLGWHAHGDREPERLARQVNPERITLLSASAAAELARRSPAEPSDTQCLEAGPFATAQSLAAATAALDAALVPSTLWAPVTIERPGSWVVVIAKFPDRKALLKRQDELRRIGVEATEVRGLPEWEPGLSAGKFAERGLAEKARDNVAQRGIRGLKVVELLAPATQTWIRAERADANAQAQLLAVKSPALGAGFGACGKALAAGG